MKETHMVTAAEQCGLGAKKKGKKIGFCLTGSGMLLFLWDPRL